jgi:7-carboxy-7-deazaguanine synthase
MDVKCPGSGEAAKHDVGNFSRLRSHDEVKFVIKDRADYDFASEVLLRESLIGRVAAVLFSPVHGVLDPRTLSAWVLADRLAVRVQLQAHKYIWGADVRGV